MLTTSTRDVNGYHGTTSYAFDALNRVWTVTDPSSGVATYDYNAIGQVATVALPNGVVTTNSYNDLNHLTRIESRTATNALIAAYAYDPDPTGRQQSVEEEHSDRIVAWGYDDVYRLTSESIVDPVNGNRTMTYAYDEVGNREEKIDSIDGTTSFAYDDNDRLTTETNGSALTSYGHDANGNRTSKASAAGTMGYIFDARNLLALATSGTESFSYEYDVDGARTAKVVAGERTNLLVDRNWENAQVLRETDSAGDELAHYVLGRGETLKSARSADGDEFMLYDAQRSVRAIANAEAGLIGTYAFDAFGRALSQFSTANTIKYGGERLDEELGLVYLRARAYDPVVGRFTSIDPWSGNFRRPRTLHAYNYAAGDPVNQRDPTGAFAETMVALSIQTTLLSSLPSSRPLVAAGLNTTFTDIQDRLRIDSAINRALNALAVMADDTEAVYEHAFDLGGVDATVGNLQRMQYVRSGSRAMFAGLVNNRIAFEAPPRNSLCLAEAGQNRFGVTDPGTMKVWLCGNFFSGAELSPAGTILHEVSHAVPGRAEDGGHTTDIESNDCDGACGDRDEVLDLAKEAPDLAVQNAYNYEYAGGLVGY